MINELNKLKEKINCSKKYRCINDSIKDPCEAKYHAVSNLMKCPDIQSKFCEFSIPFGATYACKCPLRKLIAMNFKKITKNKWS